MELWKQVLIAAAGSAAVAAFLRGNKRAGIVLAGAGMAALASEYPDEFNKIRQNVRDYIVEGTAVFEAATQVGERLARLSERDAGRWLEDVLEG